MKINTKYTIESYIDLNKTITNLKFPLKLYLIILSLASVISSMVQFYQNKQPVYIAIIPILFLITVVFLLKLRVKKNLIKVFKETPRLSESISYEILDNALVVSGKSFQSELKWSEIHKITFTKNWILIWLNSQVANGINMADSKAEFIEKLKEIIELHSIKTN